MGMSNTALAMLCLAILLVGGLGGAYVFPHEVIKEVPKEVIIKELVEIDKPVVEFVIVDIKEQYLDKALEVFLEEVEDNETLQVCGAQEYDDDQIQVSRLDKDWKLELSEDTQDVTFSVKLKYLDSDTEDKCYKTYDVKVAFEDGEDDEVEIL